MLESLQSLQRRRQSCCVGVITLFALTSSPLLPMHVATQLKRTTNSSARTLAGGLSSCPPAYARSLSIEKKDLVSPPASLSAYAVYGLSMEEKDFLFCARIGRRHLLHLRDGNLTIDKGVGEGQLTTINRQTGRSIEGVVCCTFWTAVQCHSHCNVPSKRDQ